MKTQAEKAVAFRALHEKNQAFVIPNPWDVGTARLLAHLGFEALASTSAGYAFSMGVADYHIGRERMLAHVGQLVQATDLPVSADLEAGYGDTLQEVAQTYRLAAATGLVGASIEDATGRPDDPIYGLAQATERVIAAVEAVRALPFPFTLTARAESHLHGRNDLADTIRRLQAYQEAGADVLYAPGLRTREDIASVVKALDRPVNVLMGSAGVRFSVAELSALGVKRISTGSSLSRAALGAMLRATREILDQGSFTFGDDAANYSTITAMLTDEGTVG